jgi:hypothetical protein
VTRRMDPEFPMIGAVLMDYRTAAAKLQEQTDRVITYLEDRDRRAAMAIGEARSAIAEAVAICDALIFAVAVQRAPEAMPPAAPRRVEPTSETVNSAVGAGQ